MAGRPRLPIGTFGEITTREVAPGRYRAATRFRDEDGQTRQIVATGGSRNAAKTELKQRLAERQRIGDASDSIDAPIRPSLISPPRGWTTSSVTRRRSDGTKEVYGRALRSLITPAFRHNTVREITVGRVERFLKDQQSGRTRARNSLAPSSAWSWASRCGERLSLATRSGRPRLCASRSAPPRHSPRTRSARSERPRASTALGRECAGHAPTARSATSSR